MNAARFLSLAPLQIAQALVGFGAIAAFTRLMSADEFGRYALALSISMAAHTLLFTWAEAAAFRFFAAARAEKRLADHFATLCVIAMALGALVLAATAGALAFAGLRGDVAALSAFAAGAAVLRFITRVSRESDRADLAFTRFAALETLYVVLGFAAGVACLVVFDFGAAAPFAGLALAGLIIALIDTPHILRKADGGAASLSRASAYAAYGAPLAAALALDLVVQAFARVLLANGAGTASLGAYAAAFGLARPLDLLFMGLSAAFAPLLFAAYEDEGADAARASARDAVVLIAAAALPTWVGLVLVAEPLTAFMVGEALAQETARALPWLALAGLLSGFTIYYWSEAFQLARRTGLRAVLMLAPGGLQLALTPWLAPSYGAVGAAIGAAAGAGVGFVLLAAVGRRLLALPMPVGALMRVAAATAAMGAVVFALQDYLGLGALIAAGVAVYALAALALDILGVRARAMALLRTRFAPQLHGSAP